MRKIVVIGIILSLILSTATIASAGDIYFSGWMVGSGKQHVIWENKADVEMWKTFKPLVWAGAGYIGAMTLERVILIPKTWQMKSQEIEMMKIQVKKAKALSEIEIQKAKKELEFLYHPTSDWKATPRGKQFLADLSTQVHSPHRQQIYFFDTGD